jgi:acetylglutamate kinase
VRREAHSDPAGLGTAELLVAALPRLRELHGRTVVVVAGGHVLADEKLRQAFCADIGFLRYSGVRTVVVHDGGPHVPAWSDDDPAALRGHVAGYVQRGLVGSLNDHTTLAVGMTGEDGRTLVVRNGKDVVVDPGVLRVYLDSGRIPVVSSIAYGKDDGIHHLAAAPVGAALAAALHGTLVLPAGAEVRAGAGEVGPAGAGVVDMSVPHAVLRHLHRLG